MRRRLVVVLCLAVPWAAHSSAYAQSGGAAGGAATPKVSAATPSATAPPAPDAPSPYASPPPAAPPTAPVPATSPATPPPPAAPPPPASPTGAPSAAGAASPTSVTVEMAAKPADPTAINGATYAVRLRDLEQRVDELKDQIRRSHTRLALLSDVILSGGAAGSRAEVDFKDEMSSAFLLTQALFVIDNQVQYNKQDDSGALADQKDIPIYTGSVPPGDHTISVSLTFQGNGFGVFSYLRGYRFTIKSSHAFTAVEGKALEVTATAYEEGGVTTPLEQRPKIQWHETLKPLTSGAQTGLAPAGGPPGGGAPGAAAGGSASAGGGKK